METIAAFLSEVAGAPSTQARRVRTIRRVHAAEGVPLPRPDTRRETPWRTGSGWLALGDALAATPVRGWTIGLRGRRDAFILVLAGLLNLQRAEIRTITKDEIVVTPELSIGGTMIPAGATPLDCPACAVTRWLRALGLTARGGRADVMKMLTTIRHADIAVRHDCTVPIDPRWRETWQMIPPIDIHGWIDEYQPISTRAISAIVARRQTRRVQEPAGDDLGDVSTHVDDAGGGGVDERPYADEDMDRLLDLLDEQTSATDEVLRRVEQAMDRNWKPPKA